MYDGLVSKIFDDKILSVFEQNSFKIDWHKNL